MSKKKNGWLRNFDQIYKYFIDTLKKMFTLNFNVQHSNWMAAQSYESLI